MARVPEWLLVTVEDVRIAILLDAVDRVVSAAEITPLPGSPPSIRGVANVAGEILPVFDLRRRFKLPARALLPADHFALVRAAGRKAILLIDHAIGLLKELPAALADARTGTSPAPHIRGVIIADDGLALIHDVDAFLSATESLELDAALEDRDNHVA